MVCVVARWLGLALVVAMPVASAAAQARVCAQPGDAQREPAHAGVSGAIGPFRAARVVLTRPTTVDRGAFDVRVRLGNGRCVLLAGPEDPNQLFLFDVTSVRLTPVGGARGNALVILFNSSQIGPGNGTDRQALVYRLSADRSGRIASHRRAIDGVATLAGVARRMRGRR